MRNHKTPEEKVAIKMTDLVNDYNLDIELVGKYFARVSNLVSYNRFLEVIEVAQIEKDNQNVRNSNYPLF